MRKEFSCVPGYIAQDRKGRLTVDLAEDRAELRAGYSQQSPRLWATVADQKPECFACICLFLSSLPPPNINRECQNRQRKGQSWNKSLSMILMITSSNPLTLLMRKLSLRMEKWLT